MKALTKSHRSATEAVANRFSTTWQAGNGLPDTYVLIAGKRVAVDIATLKCSTGAADGAKIRLRFDKVVIELMNRLQAALAQMVPDGMTVLLTVTAPIRLAGKTAAALEEKIQTLLERKSPGRDLKDTIHGNRIQIRLVKHRSHQAPKLLGFVHNPDTDSLLLLNITSEMLEILSAEAGRAVPKHAGDRWLIVTSAAGVSHLAAHLAGYRYICSQLRAATDFKKILMVSADGRVETLTD